MNELLVRATWAVGLAVLGVALYRLVSSMYLARARGKLLGLENIRPGVPTLLYFTSPGCQPCKTVQRPALERLQAMLGDQLQIVEIDASARPDLADFWGVLSVPTTFLVDSSNQPRLVNHGVARAEKLLQQLEKVEGRQYSQQRREEITQARAPSAK